MRRDRRHFSAGVAAGSCSQRAARGISNGTGPDRRWIVPVGGRSGADSARRRATIGAASGVGVNVGDRIITGPNGHAVLILNDQSRLEVGPGTNIALDQFTVGGGPTRVSLFSGVMRSLVNAGSGRRGRELPGAYSQRRRGGARDQVRHRVQRKCNQARIPGMRKVH